METAPCLSIDLVTRLWYMSIQCSYLEDGMAMIHLMTSISTVFVIFFLRSSCFVLASNYWYEIKRVKGPRPKPRYRHTAVVCGGSMIIFGGVDTD
jgi:drug/metabolite transporter (DMT)-like permease